LLPASSIYADLNATPNEPGSPEQSSELSPDLLLNEEYSGATYENLGPVVLDGRMTTKYRVTAGRRKNETVARVETFIWIDESLGMPVRSETISSAAELSSKVTMELKEIKLEANEQLFALPPNYRRVEAPLVLNRFQGVRALPVPKEERK
jgi:outer membrane lipoprotein-sorting protein